MYIRNIFSVFSISLHCCYSIENIKDIFVWNEIKTTHESICPTFNCTLSDLPRRECSAVSADALLDIQERVWIEFLWNPKWTRFDQLTRSNFGNFSSGSPTSMNSSLKTHVIVQLSSQTPVSSIWRWIAHQHLPLEMIDKHKWQTWI